MVFGAHRARRRFGQHWLVDSAVLDRIVAAAELGPGDRVLEVGPGRGALTERLLAAPIAELVAVELDRDLVAGLRRRFGGDVRFQLIEGDVLRVPLVPWRQDVVPPAADKVVANIPYNITGPLLERLLGRLDRPPDHRFERLVLLVQRELAERIRARPGSAAYGALSVRLQMQARCRAVCPVPPRCFVPPPRVMSEVILLEPRPPAELPPPRLARPLERLLRGAFAARRKMLRNGLASVVPPEQLEALAAAAGVDLRQRPQDLPPERWLALAEGLNRAVPPQHGDG